MASESKPERARPRASVKPGQTRRRSGGLGDLFAMDSERASRVLLIGGVGLVVLIALAFVAFGYWYGEIRPEGRTVLEADGIKVSFASMKRRMEHELRQQPSLRQQVSIIPEYAYQSLLNELTLISRAESELGITVTDEEVETSLRQRIGASPDAEPRVFADRFREALDNSGLNESEYRRLVKSDLLSNKVREKFRNEAPAEIEQAKVEVVVTNDEEAARTAIERINAGEAWANVARDLSVDPTADATGGVTDFNINGAFEEAYNDFAFSAEVGQVSDPLPTNGGAPYYVVRVIERATQTMTEQQKSEYVELQYRNWLEDTQAKMSIVRNWEEEDQIEALLDVLDAVPTPAPTQPIVVPTVQVVPSPGAGATTEAGATPASGATEPSAPNPSGAPQPDDAE